MFKWLRNIGRPNPGTEPIRSKAGQDLNEAKQLSRKSKEVSQTLDRIQDKERSAKRFWGDVDIPRVAPDRSPEELSQLENLIRNAGMALEAANLNLETAEETLRAAEGLNEMIKDTQEISGQKIADVNKKIEDLKNQIPKRANTSSLSLISP